MKPVIIELLAGEGGGKTSSVPLIEEVVRRTGRDVIRSREPGGTDFGEILRGLLLRDDHDIEPHTQQLLMQASRCEHVSKVIRPAIERGTSVILDRYLGTTISHQGAGFGLSEDFIQRVHDETAGMRADLLIVYDVAPEIGLARSLGRNGAEATGETKYENLDIGFHRRVRESCLAQARAMGGNAILLDASQPQEAVRADLVRELTRWLKALDA